MIDFDRSEKDHSSRFRVRGVFTQPGSIPAVTAPQYCRPRTPSRRLRRVANRETQAGYPAQVGLGREGNEGARASFAGISIPLRAGPVIPVCGSMDA